LYIKSLNPRTIDFIEVLEGADATIYGPGSDAGVIYVHTTNTFRPDPEDEKKGLKIFYSKGYSKGSGFQEPDYDNAEIRNSQYPDQRSTIYWNGNLVTDNSGKVRVEFYTADGSRNYSVIALGFTSGGGFLFANGKIIGK